MSHTLKTLLFDVIPKEHAWKMRLIRNWPTIAGTLHDKVIIEKIEGGTLTLGVFDSCWLQELCLLAPMLLKTINKRLDHPAIKSIRFKRASRKKQKTKPLRKTQQPDKLVPPINNKEQCALEKVCNADLRASIEAFRIRCLRET